jgi:hypothetical protein
LLKALDIRFLSLSVADAVAVLEEPKGFARHFFEENMVFMVAEGELWVFVGFITAFISALEVWGRAILFR